jgi:hypothetical protein
LAAIKGGAVKKTLIALAAAIALAGPAVLAMPATAVFASVCQPNGTGCTPGGTYPNPHAVINSNGGGLSFSITWTKTAVPPYSSGVPLAWTMGATYHNYGSLDIVVECTGPWTSASYVQEYLQGGSGDSGGYVPASSTTCSENPNSTYPLPPGAYLTLYATFNNVPWPGSSVSINWGQYGHSKYIYPFNKKGSFDDTDWANSSFCHRSWLYAPNGAAYIGITYKGVAACGNPDTGPTSNDQGPIYYTTPTGTRVYFDNGSEPGTGFQCVELTARYFYFETTQIPPASSTGSAVVRDLGSKYGYGVYPATGGTSTFQSSLKAGNIISMWSSSNQTGHVAVVTQVNVSGGNGTVWLMDENASAYTPANPGNSKITVTNGQMSYGKLYSKFQWTTNLPGT